VKDPNLTVLKPNEVSRLFQIKVDQENDRPLKLPMISISRDPSVNLQINHKTSLTCDGKNLSSNEQQTIKLDAIPIDIKYQLDIYTQRYEEGDEYIRNMVYNLINYPKLKIEIPYNDTHIEHIANIFIDPSITDNSDISERRFVDQFTR
jgi:hypothetical protein